MPPRNKRHGRKANPYNAYVQRDRQKKYYERQKTHARFKRLKRFEERNQTVPVERQALLERVLAEGADAVEADYERRLELTYGTPQGNKASNKAEEVESKPPRTKKRKRQRKTARAAASQEAPADPAGPTATALSEQSRRGRGRNKDGKAAVPDRFQKARRDFEAAEAAKAAAQAAREEEFRQRNRKRKQTAKERAVTGKLLARRNAKGQPSMQSMLELVTAKLEGAPKAGARKRQQ
eukprot:s1163_g7.t1